MTALPKWVDRDGNVWDIPMMKDDHLLRIIRMYAYRGRFALTDRMDQLEIIISEARARGLVSHALTMMDPPPCVCGRKGIYIVGETTYCFKHKHLAVARRRRAASTTLERRSDAIGETLDAVDRASRQRARLARLRSRGYK